MAQQHINYSTPNDGLGDTLRTSQVKAESNFNELYANKVDKVVGKELSDTNFTQAEKDKLAGLVEGGQAQADWEEGNSALPSYIKNKPTDVSEFFNDAGYIPDVVDSGIYARSAGGWVRLNREPIPLIAPATGAGQVFILPDGFIPSMVFVSKGLIFKGTGWTFSGNQLTIISNVNTGNSVYVQP
jgi:hypothetical protein